MKKNNSLLRALLMAFTKIAISIVRNWDKIFR